MCLLYGFGAASKLCDWFLFQALAGVFPSQFQNEDIFQQLLVFLKNKDQEIGMNYVINGNSIVSGHVI